MTLLFDLIAFFLFVLASSCLSLFSLPLVWNPSLPKFSPLIVNGFVLLMIYGPHCEVSTAISFGYIRVCKLLPRPKYFGLTYISRQNNT